MVLGLLWFSASWSGIGIEGAKLFTQNLLRVLLFSWILCFVIPCLGADDGIEVITRPLSDHGVSEVHCGLYSLYAASNALDRPLELAVLFNGEFVSSATGSTAVDLAQAAQSGGLAAVRLNGLSVGGLAELNCPVLLQLNLGHLSTTQHWVACVGVSKTGVKIIDAPRPAEEWSFAELESCWTRVAVPVWNPEVSQPSIRLVQLGLVVTNVPWLSMPVLFSLLIVAMQSRFPRIKVNSGGVAVVFQTTVIILFVSIWATIVFLLSPAKLTFGKTIEQVSCWSDDDVEVSYVKSINPAALLIDSRVRADFEYAHIDKAISLPMSTSFHEFRKFTESVDRSRPIVVYCQSVNCQWAAKTCHRLRCFDIDSQVFVGGYEMFVRQQSNRENGFPNESTN